MNELQYDYVKSHTLLFVMFLLLYELSTYVANDMIMPGMFEVIRSFQADESLVSKALTAFILGGASLQIFLGPLSDRFGRRPVMLTGSAFFLGFTIFIAFSHSAEAFIVGRFLQGMGLCFIIVIGYATLHELYSELYAVRLIAIMNMITILAPLAGPLLGAVILHFYSWRVIFIVIAIPAAIAFAGLYKYMPETLNKTKKDGTSIIPTSLKIEIIAQNYWNALKNKTFMSGAIALGLGTAPIVAWIGVSPVILVESSHLSVFDYALWQIPIFISSALGNVMMHRMTHYVSLNYLTLAGSMMILLSAVMMIIVSVFFSTHYIAIVIELSIYIFCWAFISGPLSRLTLFSTSVPKGTASAVMNLIVMLIIAMGNHLGGIIYTHHQNLYFSLFCAVLSISYCMAYYCFYRNRNRQP